jgi:hypothetical protein
MKMYLIKHNDQAEVVFTWEEAYNAYAAKVNELNIGDYAEWTITDSDMNLTAKHNGHIVELFCYIDKP